MILEQNTQDRCHTDNHHGKLVISNILFLALGIAFFIWFIPFALDQYEQETQWRAERHCEQGYHCNPKRGA